MTTETWVNTPEQQELVDRIKANRVKPGRCALPPGMKRGAQAAREAMELGLTFYKAGRKYGVSAEAVHKAWRGLFPGVSSKGRWHK